PARAVRDHDEAPKAEEVRAPVGLRVEPLAKSARPGANEHSTDLAAERRPDLRAESVEDGPDRPLERLERDVSRKAVGHHDVGVSFEQPAALRVAGETEPARAQQLVRFE